MKFLLRTTLLALGCQAAVAQEKHRDSEPKTLQTPKLERETLAGSSLSHQSRQRPATGSRTLATTSVNESSHCSQPPQCGDSCGSCDEESDQPGCDCAACECIVCQFDPFCCQPFGRWDNVCVGIAQDQCICDVSSLSPSEMPSSEPSSPTSDICDGFPECLGCGSCDEESAQAGCDCAACECAVCQIDPFCCDPNGRWDSVCAGIAQDQCICDISSLNPSEMPSSEPSSPTSDVCDGFPECLGCGSCDEESALAGCDCAACECAVCQIDPFCCDPNGRWDSVCAGIAKDQCTCGVSSLNPSEMPSLEPSSTQFSCGNSCGNCGEHSFLSGCSCDACESYICSVDDFCCNVQWDRLCAQHANEVCGCAAEPDCQNSCGDCGAPAFETGCECEDCKSLVCAADKFCCDVQWDRLCAQGANVLCGCTATFSP